MMSIIKACSRKSDATEQFHLKIETVILKNENRTGKPIFVRRKVLVANPIKTQSPIFDFKNLVEGLNERKQFLKSWNIFSQPEGVCFYRLKSCELFNDVKMFLKILVNKQLQVKVYCNQIATMSEDLDWLLKGSCLRDWSQFDRLLKYYEMRNSFQENKSYNWILDQALSQLHNLFRAATMSVREEILSRLKRKFQEMSAYQKGEIIVEGSTTADPNLIISSPSEVSDPAEVDLNFEDTTMLEEEVVEEFLDKDDDDHLLYTAPTIPDRSTVVSSPSKHFLDPSQNKTSANLFQCESCLRFFISEESLVKHMDNHHELQTAVRCEKCKETFMKRSSLKKHEMKYHQTILICEICGKQFTNKTAYSSHKSTHGSHSKSKCPHCDLVVSSSSMSRHINGIHKKLKPHKW